MPRIALAKGLTVLLMSTLLLVAIQIGLNALTLRNDFPFELRFWIALPMVLPLAIPLALLPALMLMRGTGRITAGGAATLVFTGALIAYLTVGWLTPLAQADVRDELYEAMYQRSLTNDREGRVEYPGTAVRQVRKTTPEERAEGLKKWRQSPGYLAAQAERTRPQWGRSALIAAALSLAMGALGWALGGLGRTRILHAAAWWALSWVTLMVLGGRFLYPGASVAQYIGRGPDWAPLVVFAIAATAALRASYSAPTPSASSPTAPTGAGAHR